MDNLFDVSAFFSSGFEESVVYTMKGRAPKTIDVVPFNANASQISTRSGQAAIDLERLLIKKDDIATVTPNVDTIKITRRGLSTEKRVTRIIEETQESYVVAIV